MEEIPLVYPNNADKPRRYFVDIHKARLVSCDDVVSPAPPLSSDDTFGKTLDESLSGAASVSSITLRGQDLLVTTSALVHNPDIISVALSWRKNADSLDSPILIELDVNDLQVVSVQAFTDDRENENQRRSDTEFYLVLVGSSGTVVTVTLDENLFADTEKSLRVLTAAEYIPEELQSQIVTSFLQSSMVSFLPSPKHEIVLALAPLIMTVDWLDSGMAAAWSETQCLEDMKARKAYFRGISITNILLPKSDAGIVDMPPVAALCVASDLAAGRSSTFVFTLHSDASIRKWAIDPAESLVPLEVTTLEVESLSAPNTWSGERNSVKLCARLYGQVFALAVSIKTETLQENGSNCHLWAFDGLVSIQEKISSMALVVPDDAVSVVDIAFKPVKVCCLSAAFETSVRAAVGRVSAGGMKVVTYPHSNVSIIESVPAVVEITGLDQIAKKEQQRARALQYGKILSDDIENGLYDSVSSVEEMLHELDSMYMKHLFRPIYPRGNGTVLPPLDVCIRRALSKLMHGAVEEHGMTIELETVKTLYEWRKRDRRKTVAGVRTQSQGVREVRTDQANVYDSFVEDQQEGDEIERDAGNMDVAEQFELDLHFELEAHESRWESLLLQIWEEEQIFRGPLCIAWLEKCPSGIIIRGGITTALSAIRGQGDRHRGTRAVSATLDEGALGLLSEIDNHPKKSRELFEVENRALTLVSGAQYERNLHAQTSIIQGLTFLGRWAQLVDESKFRDILVMEAKADILSWLEEKPENLLHIQEPHGFIRRSSQQIANTQLRHAGCSCSVRAVDDCRRFRLAKCILLLKLSAGDCFTTPAIRSYFHSISILWVGAQRLKMPESALRPSTVKVQFDVNSRSTSSPPNKRLSFGDVPSSIIGSGMTITTSLDIVAIEISQEEGLHLHSEESPISNVFSILEGFVNRVFRPYSTAICRARPMFPELGALPEPRVGSIATDHPGLALRLLAPFVAFPIPEDDTETVAARNEEFSTSLLYSSQSSALSASTKSWMRQRACELLVPQSRDSKDSKSAKLISDGFLLLDSICSKDSSGEELEVVMRLLLPNASSIEMTRVLKRDLTGKVFSSLTMEKLSSLSNIQRSSLMAVARGMLQLARIFHRLGILENYVSFRKNCNDSADVYNSDSLLQIISDAIVEIEGTFPEEVYLSSNEYRSLWTTKFNHSRCCRQWSEAYAACLRNPVASCREDHLRLLVKDMVDNGALQMLLELCTAVGFADSEESVDLYEIASEVLMYNSKAQNFYELRAASLDASGISDYQGALYALYTSQEHWRRAAQALDLRYSQACMCLRARVSKSRSKIQSTELRDGLIVADVMLATCGSAIAITLVKDTDHRFLVHGEYGPFSELKLGTNKSEAESNKLKRGYFPNEHILLSQVDSEESGDRQSRFMDTMLLNERAIRCICLRTLFFDGSLDSTATKKAFSCGETSIDDLNATFSSGYYNYGLILAKAWSDVFGKLNGSTKHCGSDLFGSRISSLVSKFLIPLASSAEAKIRPTLQQLVRANDAANLTEETACHVVPDRSSNMFCLRDAAIAAASSNLIMKYTLNFSSAEIPVAVDVAESYLRQTVGAQLPVWLENILMSGSAGFQNGAFAPRPEIGVNSYLGDPSRLLTMYTRCGMFEEACKVVALVLRARCSELERSAKAAACLPEKGDIDFVPYRSIDILWNLIEISVSKGSYTAGESARILKSREEMEMSLSNHFEMMNLSEEGMKSARLMRL